MEGDSVGVGVAPPLIVYEICVAGSRRYVEGAVKMRFSGALVHLTAPASWDLGLAWKREFQTDLGTYLKAKKSKLILGQCPALSMYK